MTVNLSNTQYLTILPAQALEGVGWTVRVLSERDYVTPVALVERFAGLGFTVEANEVGGGTVTLDADDPIFAGGLPAGESTRLVDQEALWQVLEDGQVRFEFLAEDVEEDVIPDGGGPRTTVIAGRGTASVLEWAPVLPAGMPTPTSMSREFNAHPMTAWAQLFAEAQAEGFLPWVSLSFDGAMDSHALPWGPAQALTVSAGDTLLDLLKRWCEANELVWRMLPGWVLEVRQDEGSRLEGSVVFTQYRSQGGHKRKVTRRELANVIYADSGDNGLAFAEDSTSAGKWRKRAAWISAGDSGDASARSMIANTSLSLAKDQRQSRTIQLIPDREGRQPFVDFSVHDWVGVEVPDDDSESGAVKVVGLAVDIDSDGVVQYEATLSSRFEVRAVKIQRLLDKMGGSERSGSGSAAASPIPVAKSMSVVKLADLSDVDLTSPAAGALLQWNGARWIDVVGNLDLLADVVTSGASAPTNGQALVYDSASGLWKPGTVAGGGGGGSGGLPTVRATSSNYAASGSTATVTVPASAVVGDMLIVFVGADWNVANKTGYAGWWNIGFADGSNTNISAFAKICEAGDIGAVKSFTLGGGTAWTAWCVAVQGGKFVRPSPSAQFRQGSSGSSQTFTAPVAPIGANDLVLLWGGCRTGSKTVTWTAGTAVASRTADGLWSSALWKIDGGVLVTNPTVSTVGGAALGGLCQAGLAVSGA